MAKSAINEARSGLKVVFFLDLWKWFLSFYIYNGKVNWELGSELSLRIRELGRLPVLLRLGTNDFSTLKYVYIDKFHLPTIDMLESPKTILDIGCNVGYTLLHYSYKYPKAEIVGYEMDEDNVKQARKNVGATAANVSIVHSAVSSHDGNVLYDKNFRACDSYSISKHGSQPQCDSEIMVASASMHSVVKSFGSKRINYLKMDIEGEELNIFRNDQDLTWLDLVDSLNIEVHSDIQVAAAVSSLIERFGFNCRFAPISPVCCTVHAWRDGSKYTNKSNFK